MEFRDKHAIYQQIVDHFMDNILEGKWKDNEKIPSVRALAVELEVNPNTVVRSYNLMQEQGIIYNKRGIGYFVADDARKHILQLRKGEFINQRLPLFFKEIALLDISLEEIKSHFEEWKNTNDKNLPL